MATKTYSEQLKDPRWQKKRLEIMERDKFTCQRCYDDESTLHVHHKHYHKGRMPWDYEPHELVTLCESCHEGVHDEDAGWKDVLARLPLDGPCSKFAALPMLAGWAFMFAQEEEPLKAYFKQSPHSFRIGEVAAFLEFLTMDDLRDLIVALQVDSAERSRRVRAFVEQYTSKDA